MSAIPFPSETPATIEALSEALERVSKQRDELGRRLAQKTAELEQAYSEMERLTRK